MIAPRRPVRADGAAQGRAMVCEACGGVFRCGAAQAHCWCAGITLADEVRADLGARYRRCLCRACLERAAGRSPRGWPV